MAGLEGPAVTLQSRFPSVHHLKEREVGKGTDALRELTDRPLSDVEIAEREAALEAGGQREATLDGTLITPWTPTEAVKEVVRAPQQTWD